MRELDVGNTAAARLLSAAGCSYSSHDRQLLMGYATDLMAAAPADQERFGAMVTGARQGFYHCAAEGVAFVPLDRFAEQFGSTIDANYPGAGGAFVRLATSYWTLRILERQLRLRFAGVCLQQLLRSVEEPVAELFFADADDTSMAAGDRAARQRAAINESGAPIDAEEFLFGNPLLLGNPLA